MKGITISDQANGLLTFDLIDILNVIGDKVVLSAWKLSGVEAVGSSADEIHRISDDQGSISGSHLISIASDLIQTIDGYFHGFFANQTSPWIIIRAVDSSEFDVETDDEITLEKLRQRFDMVAEFPSP